MNLTNKINKGNAKGLGRKVGDAFLAASAAAAFSFGSYFVNPNYAEAQPVCGSHKEVMESLKGNYSEKPTFMGLANNGAIVEVYTNKDGGNWTIVMTAPNGVSCLLAAGDYWRELKDESKGRKINLK